MPLHMLDLLPTDLNGSAQDAAGQAVAVLQADWRHQQVPEHLLHHLPLCQPAAEMRGCLRLRLQVHHPACQLPSHAPLTAVQALAPRRGPPAARASHRTPPGRAVARAVAPAQQLRPAQAQGPERPLRGSCEQARVQIPACRARCADQACALRRWGGFLGRLPRLHVGGGGCLLGCLGWAAAAAAGWVADEGAAHCLGALHDWRLHVAQSRACVCCVRGEWRRPAS